MNCELSYIKHKLYKLAPFQDKKWFFFFIPSFAADVGASFCCWCVRVCVCALSSSSSSLSPSISFFLYVLFTPLFHLFMGYGAVAVTAWNIIYSLWLYNLNFFGWQEQYLPCLSPYSFLVLVFFYHHHHSLLGRRPPTLGPAYSSVPIILCSIFLSCSLLPYTFPLHSHGFGLLNE